MAELSLDITLPAAYDPAIREVQKALRAKATCIVEHAALRGRFDAFVAAMAIAHVLQRPRDRPANVAVLAPTVATIRYFIQDWFDRGGHSLRRRFGSGSVKCIDFDARQLWLLEPKDADSFPRASIDGLLVFGAQHLDAANVKFFRSLNAGGTVLIGSLPDREHWFYKAARQDPARRSVRIAADVVAKAFPDQRRILEEERKRLDKTTFARTMQLLDVVSTGFGSFSRFSRTRLWVRSDKDRRFLDKAQLAIATKAEGTPLLPFHASPVQKRYLAAKRLARMQGKPPRFLLLKYRRGGFTTVEQGQSYELCCEKPRSSVATLAHTAEATARIFKMVHTFHENDPHAPRLLGVGNARRLAFADNRSEFFIGTAGSSAFGRGDTLNRVHGSEVAFWCEGPNQFDDVNNLVAGLTEAASNGEVVLESTPNGVNWFCTTYKDAKQGLNNYTPIFLPWFSDPANVAMPGTFNPEEIQDTLTDREKELISTFKLSLAQIAFRRSKIKENRTLFVQEYPEDDVTCFLVSGTLYFDPEMVQTRLGLLQKKAPPTKKQIPGGHLWTAKKYTPEELKGRRFVVGSDTSEGIPGCDPSGYGVMDHKTGEQVEWTHGLFKPAQLGEMVHKASKKWNDALIGIERQNHGHAVIQKVQDLGGKQARSHEQGGVLFHYNGDRAGWSTDATSRPVLLSMLAQAIEDRADGWNDALMLDECTTFRKQSDGQWRADSNCHDDAIIKWGIAEQMRHVPVHGTSTSSY